MDKTKRVTEQKTDTGVTLAMYWGTITLAVLGVVMVAYVLSTLFQLPRTGVVYFSAGINILTIAAGIAVIVLTLRGYQGWGARLEFYMVMLLFGVSPIIYVGRALTASFSLAVIGTIIILQLLPRFSRRRWYFAIMAAVVALIWVIEWINPGWRLQTTEGQVGPATAIIFGFILAYIIVRQTWGRSMRNNLLVAFVGVTLVAIGALAVYVFVSTTNILRRGLERELTQHAEAVAVSIGDLFSEQINILTTLSLNEIFQQAVADSNQAYTGDITAIQAEINAKDAQWQAADKAGNNNDPLVREHLTNVVALDLLEFQRAFPNNVEVFVTDMYGGLAGATNRTSDYNQADEAWWQATYNHGQGAIYIGEPEYDESTGVLAVLIALPLRNRETGEVTGILRTTYLASAIGAVLSERLGETGETDLYIPGEVVFHFHAGEYTPVSPEEYAIVRALVGRGLVEMTYDDVPSVLLYTTLKTSAGNPVIEYLGWEIVFHQTQVEAFAPVNTQIRGILVVLAGILVLAVGAAIGLSVFLVRPIIRLTQTAEKIAAGNLDTRAQVTGADEIGSLASTLNTMTSRLQETLAGLEQRVAARTKDLATVAEVGAATATILETNRLLQEVVDLTKERFNLYHSHIYLLDEIGENLVLAAGAGEVGRIMIAEKISIAMSRERSLVARAARDRKGVTVNDVSQEIGFLPNPLLPNTRSELAVPMIAAGNLIGVFDIQSDQAGRFTESDISIQTTLAAQVAISIQNVRQFEQSKAQAELETMVNAIGQKIQRTGTVEETLQTAVRELGLALGASRVHAAIQAGQDGGDQTTSA